MLAIKRDSLDLTSVTESPCRADGWKAATGKLLFCADPAWCCPSLPGQWLQQPGADTKQQSSVWRKPLNSHGNGSFP